MPDRILIIEDDELLATSFQRLLLEAGYVTDVAGDFNGGMDLLANDSYGAIFADINLQGAQTGIDLLKEIRGINIDTPVVIMTGFPEVATAAEAVRNRAFDYLCKPVEKERLLAVAAAAMRQTSRDDAERRKLRRLENTVQSMREVLAGADDVVADTTTPAEAPAVAATAWEKLLSERERQVLDMLGHGESSPDIAARHCISIRTVGTYYARIIEKLELGNMKALKQFAIRNIRK